MVVIGSILTAFLSTPVVCQVASPTPSREEREFAFLRDASDDLSSEILTNLSSVDESSQAVYLVQLSKLYWDEKPEFARKQLDTAEKILDHEIRSDDRTRVVRTIDALKKVLPVLLALDQKQGLDFCTKAAKTLDEKKGYDVTVSDLYAVLASKLLDRDPTEALALARRSLLIGQPLAIASLIAKEYAKDPEKADELFELALVAARRGYSYEFIGSLGTNVYGMSSVASVSNSVRADYLKALSDVFSTRLASEPTLPEKYSLAPLMKEFVPAFGSYLPALADRTKQQLVFCGTTEEGLAEVTSDLSDKTPGEVIKAAQSAHDVHTKARLYALAVSKMSRAKDYLSIVSMLDDMEASEKNNLGDNVWQSWRIDYTTLAALAFFKDKDLGSTYRLIDKSPPEVRPFVRFRLANSVSVDSNREFVLENLQAIRKELSAVDFPKPVAASSCLTLTRLYARIQPEESPDVFADAVKLINKVDDDNPDAAPEKDFAPLEDVISMPYQLLTTDQTSLRVSLAAITSKRSRIRLELGLVQSSLKRKKDLASILAKGSL